MSWRKMTLLTPMLWAKSTYPQRSFTVQTPDFSRTHESRQRIPAAAAMPTTSSNCERVNDSQLHELGIAIVIGMGDADVQVIESGKGDPIDHALFFPDVQQAGAIGRQGAFSHLMALDRLKNSRQARVFAGFAAGDGNTEGKRFQGGQRLFHILEITGVVVLDFSLKGKFDAA